MSIRNGTKLLRDREYTEALLALLASARRSIEASVFLIDPGETGRLSSTSPVPNIL